jgi:trans-aconitate 2-methyltransferase
MMAWDPGQYLKFADERSRPAADLAARVPLAAPRTIVDLGCGAGNVTRMLAQRWPAAAITGVDLSAAMLAQARASTDPGLRIEWQEADIARWSPSRGEPGLLFSNAALHWQDDHGTLFPRLLSGLRPGAVLAVQMPDNFTAPSHRALADTVLSARWRAQLGALLRPAPVASGEVYFRWLAPYSANIDLWTTEYLHVLAPKPGGDHPVVAWMRGTALTPYLSELDAAAQREFVAELESRVAAAYPAQADGRVLFGFRRRFIVAVRADR